MPRPTNATLRSNCARQVDEDLHPVDARRERGDDQPPARAGEDLLERLDDFGFRAGEAAAIDVGAVGEQRQHALGAELREAVQVEVLAVERRLIDLEVAGVDDDADRRVNRQRHAVGHAVRDADELDRERADGDPIARSDRHERRRVLEAVLPQLAARPAPASAACRRSARGRAARTCGTPPM